MTEALSGNIQTVVGVKWRETTLSNGLKEKAQQFFAAKGTGKINNACDFTPSFACGNTRKMEVFGVRGFFS